MKIGVISDTHDYLDPRVFEIFSGVEHILHGGDIGHYALLAELQTVAPVTAVSGNTDDDPSYLHTASVTLASRKFLLHHIVTPGDPNQAIHRRIASETPDVVVFGHTHKPLARQMGRTLFFNPGYAGRQRFSLPRSVALLDCTPDGVKYEFINL